MPDSAKPAASGRRTAASACAVVVTAAVILQWLRSDPRSGMAVTTDFAHQLFVLEWLKRSVFEGAGVLISPPMFYPSAGTLATTEVPLLQSLLYSLFRFTGGTPALAWNFTYGFFSATNFMAALIALRGEKRSLAATVAGALVFASALNWLRLTSAIWYMTAFGIPLSWHFVTKIRDSEREWQPAAALAAVLFLQFLAGAATALAALFLVSIRFAAEPALRRKALPLFAAMLPVLGIGFAWSLICQNAFAAWNVTSTPVRISSQIGLRIDLADLLPFTSFPASHWPAGVPYNPTGYVGLPVPILLILCTGLLISSAGSSGGGDPVQRRRRTIAASGIAAAGITAVHLVAVPAFSHSFDLPIGVAIATDLALIGYAFVVWKLPPRFGTETRTAGAVIFGIILLALGPVIFVAGQPLLVGPLGLLDIVLPGFDRLRVPGRLLIAASYPVALLVTRLSGEFRKIHEQAPLALAAALGLWLLWSPRWGFTLWPPTAYRPLAISLPPEACPGCGADPTRTVPLPYRYLQSIGSPPVIEIPSRKISADGMPLYEQSSYLFYAALDGIPRGNGIGAMQPEGYLDFEAKLAGFPSGETLDLIRARGINWIVLNGQKFSDGEWQRLAAELSPPPAGVEIVKTWGRLWILRLTGGVSSPPAAPPASPTGN